MAVSLGLVLPAQRPSPANQRRVAIRLTAPFWQGKYRNWRVERRLVQTTPERFASFREALSPYRPKGELSLQDKPPCHTFWFDVDGVRVEWQDASGTDRLLLNFGCDPESNRAMADALRAAPDLLGIARLRIPWGQWSATAPS